MKEYNVFQAFYMSFYSKKLYQDVHRNWGASAAFYLLLLTFVLFTLRALSDFQDTNHTFQNFSNHVVMQFPVVNIVNGEVKTPENKVYTINMSAENDTPAYILIDTTGQYKSLYDTPEKTHVLVTTNEVMYYDNPEHKKLTITKIPSNLSIALDPNVVKDKLVFFGDMLVFLAVPFVTLVAFLYRILQALFYSLIGKIYAKATQSRLTYGEIFKLSLITITPAFVINMIYEGLKIYFPILSVFAPVWWIIILGLGIGYLFFAIKANKA